MRLRDKIVLSVIFSIAFVLFACSFQPSPKKIIRDYIESGNSHQVSIVMGHFTDDITFQAPKMGIEVSGKEDMRPIVEYDSALHATLTPANMTVSGDTVFCSITEHNDWVEAAEIPDVYYPQVMFVIEDEKISHIRAEMSDSSKENYERVLDSFVFWGNDNYPEKMRKMAPDGYFIYNAENGAMVVEMLREWKAEQKQGQREPVSGMMPKRKNITK